MNLLEQQTFIKKEYPAMPQEIRDMIETEVRTQMENETTKNSESKFNKKMVMRYAKAAALGIVLGSLTVGGCVTAHKLYTLHSQKTGNYSVQLGMEDNPGAAKSEEIIVPKVSLKITGQSEDLHFQTTGYKDFNDLDVSSCKIHVFKEGSQAHAATIYIFSLPDGYESFKISDTNVKSTEEFSIDGNPVSYLDLSYVQSGRFQNTSKLYMIFPKLNHMVMIYGHNGMEKEEMISIAKGIKLSEASGEETVCNTMELKAGEVPFGGRGNEAFALEDELTGEEKKTFAKSEEFLSNLHQVGDEVSVKNYSGNVTVKLSSVKVCSNINEVPEGLYNHLYGVDIKDKCDEGGNFLPEDLQYVNRGNGVDTVDTIVKTDNLQEKLVVLAFEYTNKGDTDIGEYCFDPGHLVTIREKDGGYEIYNYDSLAKQAGVDAIVGKNYDNLGSCAGWDNGGDLTRKNEIADFKAGETRTVYSAFFVNTDQLSDIYLDILSGHEDNGSFGSAEYDNPLEAGYFDIRR